MSPRLMYLFGRLARGSSWMTLRFVAISALRASIRLDEWNRGELLRPVQTSLCQRNRSGFRGSAITRAATTTASSPCLTPPTSLGAAFRAFMPLYIADFFPSKYVIQTVGFDGPLHPYMYQRYYTYPVMNSSFPQHQPDQKLVRQSPHVLFQTPLYSVAASRTTPITSNVSLPRVTTLSRANSSKRRTTLFAPVRLVLDASMNVH